MRYSELRQKQVINCCDGERLGFVCDICLNPCNGEIEKLIVPGPCRFLGLFGHDQEYHIPFRCVRTIGPDVVLVEINAREFLCPCRF